MQDEDLPPAHFGEDGLVPELLARMHVGHMHLDDGDFDSRDRVADGVGIVRERARIQNDTVIHALRLPDLRAELPFKIALKEVRLMPVRLHESRNALVDALQRIRAVHALFAHARAPEIDAVQNQKLHILSPSLRCPPRSLSTLPQRPRGPFSLPVFLSIPRRGAWLPLPSAPAPHRCSRRSTPGRRAWGRPPPSFCLRCARCAKTPTPWAHR